MGFFLSDVAVAHRVFDVGVRDVLDRDAGRYLAVHDIDGDRGPGVGAGHDHCKLEAHPSFHSRRLMTTTLVPLAWAVSE